MTSMPRSAIGASKLAAATSMWQCKRVHLSIAGLITVLAVVLVAVNKHRNYRRGVVPA